MNYYSFDSDGNIQNIGSCLESVFHLYKSDGLTYVAGTANSNVNYVLDGVLKEYTPEELSLKSNCPGLGYKWIGKDRVWLVVKALPVAKEWQVVQWMLLLNKCLL